MKEIMDKLQAPFSPLEIEWRVGSTNSEKTKGLALAYVTNRAIQNRLDEVFGCFGWKNEFREWRGNSQLCGISILHEGEWITKWDGADDSNMEATKGGLSDAMKRAAYQWGIGRYLYELPNVWVRIKQAGKSYIIDETPSLPKWALPEGVDDSPKQGTKPGQTQEKVPDKPKKEEADPGLVKLMKHASKQLGQETAKECLVNYLASKKHSAITDVLPTEYDDLKAYIDNYELPDILQDTHLPGDL